LIESLYNPSQKDLASGIIQARWRHSATVATAATTVVVTCPNVEPDRVLFLQTISYNAVPGAGQSCLTLHTNIDDAPGGLGVTILGPLHGESVRGNVAERIRRAFNFGPGVMIFPGERLQGRGEFSAAGVANTLEYFAYGFTIPRGTLFV